MAYLGQIPQSVDQAISLLNQKQNTLVSGTNIKTVGGVQLLGSGDLPERHDIIVISTNTTAVAGKTYVATATVTLTLPAQPAVGDTVGFNNQQNSTTSVIDPGTNKINAISETMQVDTAFASMQLVFTGTTNGWVLI